MAEEVKKLMDQTRWLATLPMEVKRHVWCNG